jgi:predicted Zn-dependent protease
VLFLVSFAGAHAQLPPGTTDASRVQVTAPADPRLTQANEALDRQDYLTALRLLNALVEDNPTDATLLYNLGFTHDALSHDAEAAAAYQRSIAADATYFNPRLALGLLLARQGKLPEAHAQLATAITLQTPESALKARAYRALARLDQSTDPAAASTDLLEALKLSPESVAEAAYRRILATHTGDPAITAALAHLLLTLHRAPEAETLLTAALTKQPGDPTLTSQLAAAYAAEDKTADALTLIEKLHTASPDNAAITRLLAHLYTDDKQPEKAEPLYAALLARSPKDATLLADQGETLLKLHLYSDAQLFLSRALADPKAFPNPADLGYTAENLAFAASHNKSPELVLQALAVRASVLPQSPASLFLAATAHDTLHHTKQASELYKQFLAAAAGKYPDQEWEASHRLLALDHMK